jgi:ribosome-associated protein
MIEITPDFSLPAREISFDFVRASGPGGQNVNKVASAVQLRFDVTNSPSLSEAVKKRLSRLAGSRMTNEGVLIIEAKSQRTQEQNRAAAVERLAALIRRALEKPKKRKPTRPGKAAREKRLQEKKRRGELKRQRRKGPEGW